MVALKKEGIILRKTELAFESEGVLNPAVIQENGKIHLFYRAVAKIPYKKFTLLTESQGTIAGKYEHSNTFPPIQDQLAVSSPLMLPIPYWPYLHSIGFLKMKNTYR